MKIYRGTLPAISPEFGCANGEAFDDHVVIETPRGYEQLICAGVRVHPEFAKAIKSGIRPTENKRARSPKENK